MSGPSAAVLQPLSRFLQESDYGLLTDELSIVDARWDGSQHERRRWEYALALHAMIGGPCSNIVDVGGAGSPFFLMVKDWSRQYATVIDPKYGMTLAQYLATNPKLADVIFCLSVLEHVQDEDQFLYHLSCLLAPGGLLVLTMDAVGEEVSHDSFHFSWMRERIYTPARIQAVVNTLSPLRITPEAEPNFSYFAPLVFDYSFASLVCSKSV